MWADLWWQFYWEQLCYKKPNCIHCKVQLNRSTEKKSGWWLYLFIQKLLALFHQLYAVWYSLGTFSLTSWVCSCAAGVIAIRMGGVSELKGVEWLRKPWEVFVGLTMELVSETDEQTMVFGEATVRTRCLAMFATPMRERATKNKV